jgi:hypothetical protein
MVYFGPEQFTLSSVSPSFKNFPTLRNTILKNLSTYWNEPYIFLQELPHYVHDRPSTRIQLI